MELLKFGPGELSSGYLVQSFRGTWFTERGPRRPWDRDPEWKHPAVVQKEERGRKEKERLRLLEEKERAEGK